MTKRFALFTLFAFLFSNFLSAQNEEKKPRLQGLLWEISKDDISKKGYLYGTMHVPRKLAFNLSDTFFLALKYADVVALETDHDQWQEFSKQMNDFEQKMGRGYGGGYGSSRYMGNLYGSFNFSTPENQLLGMLLAAKPSMTNQLMYRSNTYAQEYEEDTYLDQFIFQAGKKLGKEVGGLETLEGSYSSAMRSQIPDEDAEDNYYGGYGNVGPGAIEEAYREQDLTKLDSLNQLSNPSKNFQKHMLDVRNIVHANGIDSILQLGKAVFAGVGAAHLPGKTGVIQLLRDSGYTVRPVVFTNTDVALNLKKELEDARFPVQMSRQWSEDSVWSVKAPGKFYQSLDRGELEQHLSADMGNGAYYAVYRLNTFGHWNGQSPEYIQGRIDSLIYEYTPGKIQSRQAFNDPVPGHEITTRTRRGDIQRYKFYVMPNEALLFTTGGIGDYAEGAEADEFMNSIEVQSKVGKKGKYEPKGKGYRIDFPNDLIVNMPVENDPAMHFVSAYDEADSSMYFLYRYRYPDHSYIEEDTFELNIITEKIAEAFTDSLPEMTLVSESPYPTQDFYFKSDKKEAHYFGRLLIDGDAYYLAASRRTKNERPETFLNSFSLQKEQYPQGFYIKTDTTLMFEVETLREKEIEEHPFFEEFSAIIDEIQAASRKRYNETVDDDAKRNSSVTLEDEGGSGQQIFITTGTMKSYSYIPTVDSFKVSMRDIASAYKKLSIKEEKWERDGDNHLEAYFVASDTNSNRIIHQKVIAHNNGFYRLSTVVNGDVGPSPFVEKVFGSFRSTDTVYKALPFGIRDLDFLSNLYDSDSLTSSKAVDELKNHGSSYYEEEDFDLVRMAIQHPGFDTMDAGFKSSLFDAMSGVESRKAVDFLQQYFKKHPDSAMVRQMTVTALSYIRTRYAQDAFFDLLEEEPVYLGEYGGLGAVTDSLELAAKFVDDLVDLAQMDKYENQVLNLLYRLQKKGLIKPKSYRKLKNRLRQDVAAMFAKRQYDAEKNRFEKNSYYNFDPFLKDSEERDLALLQPFIKKDKEVRATLDYALRHGDRGSKLAISGIYLQEGLPVDNKSLKTIADDEKSHFVAYKTLAKAGVLSRYTNWFQDTTKLIESMILNSTKEVDSLQFISKHKAVFKNKPANLYFYDIKEKKGKEWGLAVVTIPQNLSEFYEAKDGEDNDYYDEYYSRNPRLVETLLTLTGAKKDEYIKKKVSEIRFVNRERYRSVSAYDYDYDYDYGY